LSISRSALSVANDANTSAAFLNGAAPAGGLGGDATDPKLMGSMRVPGGLSVDIRDCEEAVGDVLYLAQPEPAEPTKETDVHLDHLGIVIMPHLSHSPFHLIGQNP
jgi:hypothetical protein